MKSNQVAPAVEGSSVGHKDTSSPTRPPQLGWRTQHDERHNSTAGTRVRRSQCLLLASTAGWNFGPVAAGAPETLNMHARNALPGRRAEEEEKRTEKISDSKDTSF